MKQKRGQKAKTHKALRARVKFTNGKKVKVMRRKKLDGSRTKASKSSKLRTRKLVQVANVDLRVVKRLIPGI
jgi:hypothetical protein